MRHRSALLSIADMSRAACAWFWNAFLFWRCCGWESVHCFTGALWHECKIL